MLNVITLFSGYDSQCLALNRLGLPYDLAAWCEIDRHAIKALSDEYGVTRGKIRRYCSAKASYLFYLCTLPKETQKAISDGKIPYSIATALRRVKDPHTHHEILMQVINGNLSLTKTKQLVSEKMKELKDNGK